MHLVVSLAPVRRVPEPRAQPARVAVVAFGGNAIALPGQRGTAAEQLENLAEMARAVVGMIESGWSVVLTHGNGPQVGAILLQQEAGEPASPAMPLDVCGAMSQGQIGYLLQQALSLELARRGVERPVVTLLTRCLVDPDDPAFRSPTKPVGPFYDATAAGRMRADRHWSVVADADRGHRRVVPSPTPRRVVELEAIRVLVQAGSLVIAGGGGGVPVVPAGRGGYRGVEAVIDKDLAACALARDLGARQLLLLTGVPEVFVDYGTPRQRRLGEVSAAEIETLAAEGHFPAGSMGPKVQAAVDFARGGGEAAIITSPALALDALAGRAGTRVYHAAAPGSDRPAGGMMPPRPLRSRR